YFHIRHQISINPKLKENILKLLKKETKIEHILSYLLSIDNFDKLFSNGNINNLLKFQNNLKMDRQLISFKYFIKKQFGIQINDFKVDNNKTIFNFSLDNNEPQNIEKAQYQINEINNFLFEEKVFADNTFSKEFVTFIEKLKL